MKRTRLATPSACGATLLHGDCLDRMQDLAEHSVDAIVTDPPYGIGFMGKHWDYGVPGVEFWLEMLRVAKPGAHLLAFGGTRTVHRMVCAIEDAGWQIRDRIGWLYGSGFPKSHNLTGDWTGWGTALKPAHEPIVVARKPLSGTVAANVQEHGTGAMNIDGCRIAGEPWKAHSATGLGSVKFFTEGDAPVIEKRPHEAGRWPANIIHDGSKEATAGLAEAASFFYCAKSSKADRGRDNSHPTVKPTALMRYLCRLVTPPGGTVLDPFAGSGSTGKAALLEGFRFIGIERESAYLEIARSRLAAHLTPEGNAVDPELDALIG